MSTLAATQLDKPGTGEAFERACTILFRQVLGREVKRFGRSGQSQGGIDHYAIVPGQPPKLVAIQCKKRDYGKPLREKAFKAIVAEALTFDPPVNELYICTTAPDDAELDKLAIQLSLEQQNLGRDLTVYHWGWQTIEQRALDYAEAIDAFDPTYGAGARRLEAKIDDQSTLLQAISRHMGMRTDVLATSVSTIAIATQTAQMDPVERHLDSEIDSIRDLLTGGQAKTALRQFEKLLDRVHDTASGRLVFRIKANIGHAHLVLGDEEEGLRWIEEAVAHAPDEPKAAANRVLVLMRRNRIDDALMVARLCLTTGLGSEALSAYFVQSLSLREDVPDPLQEVPEAYRDDVHVRIAEIVYLRQRGRRNEWWTKAQALAARHPDDDQAQRFAADAVLDEIFSSESFQHSQILLTGQRDRLATALATLRRQWNVIRVSEVPNAPEATTILCNAMSAAQALRDRDTALDLARQAVVHFPNDHDAMLRAGMIAQVAGEIGLAREALAALPDNAEANELRLALAMETSDFKEAERIVTSAPLPDYERESAAALAMILPLHRAGPDTSEAEWRACVAAAAGDARASILVSILAGRVLHEQIAREAYSNAVAAMEGGGTYVANRIMVGIQACRHEDWRTAIRLLQGAADPACDSRELRYLVEAHTNAVPVTNTKRREG